MTITFPLVVTPQIPTCNSFTLLKVMDTVSQLMTLPLQEDPEATCITLFFKDREAKI